MASHRIHCAPLPEPAGAVGVASGPDAIGDFLEDAAHHPGGHAAGVAHPATEAEVGALLRPSQRVLPVGAQSSLTGGATPLGEVVVTTRRLNRIVTAGSNGITAQAGVPIAELQEALARCDAWYPPTPTFEGACIGGAAATNAAGAATFKYGATRDWIRGLRVVLADGSLLELHRGEHCAHTDGYFELHGAGGVRRIPLPGYRMPDVPKRSAGYFARPGMDAVDLFIGSEGTLGVITEVTCDVVSPRPEICLVWLTLPDDAGALALVAALRREARAARRSRDPRGMDVAAVEHLDRRSLELVREDGADRRPAWTFPRTRRSRCSSSWSCRRAPCPPPRRPTTRSAAPSRPAPPTRRSSACAVCWIGRACSTGRRSPFPPTGGGRINSARSARRCPRR